jgi:16S rRNA (cytosine1402-N4)-methyltransferase
MHAPVLLREVIRRLQPRKDDIVADCTIGYAGHAFRLAEQIGPGGKLIGLDLDDRQIDAAAQRLAKTDAEIHLHHENFARLGEVMRREGIDGFDVIFADLGVSSMQIDKSGRGIGYGKKGPLDMRLDPEGPVTASDLLASMSAAELSEAFLTFGDEPDHHRIAEWIVNQRGALPLTQTQQLVRLILNAKGLSEANWKKSPKSNFGQFHPAARVFQALRILVNREMENLEALLEQLPAVLAPGARVGLLSFQPHEDRKVREAFEAGMEQGVYEEISRKPITPSQGEVYRNRRCASARFRWARRARR